MLPEAIILATATVVESVAKLVETIAKTQTPQQQKIMWDWYIEDMKQWRKLWGLKE